MAQNDEHQESDKKLLFDSTSRRSPAIASYVRIVRMSQMDNKYTRTILLTLLHFPRLETLSLTYADKIIDVPNLAVFSPTVTTLMVSHIVFRTLDGWHALIAGFPHLRNLMLGSSANILHRGYLNNMPPVGLEEFPLRLDSLLVHFGHWHTTSADRNDEGGLSVLERQDKNAIARQWLPRIRLVEASKLVVVGANVAMSWFADVWSACDMSIEELQLETGDQKSRFLADKFVSIS